MLSSTASTVGFPGLAALSKLGWVPGLSKKSQSETGTGRGPGLGLGLGRGMQLARDVQVRSLGLIDAVLLESTGPNGPNGPRPLPSPPWRQWARLPGDRGGGPTVSVSVGWSRPQRCSAVPAGESQAMFLPAWAGRNGGRASPSALLLAPLPPRPSCVLAGVPAPG